MSDAGRPRAVLDSDIIYSRVLHDLMGRAARDLRLLQLFWSDELLAEARTSLEEKKGLSRDSAWRWVEYLSQNFPSGRIDLRQASGVDLASLTSDPADAHVCALAVAATADYLFTHDRGYLRNGLGGFGVQVIAPDEFSPRCWTPTPEECSTFSSDKQQRGREGDRWRSCSLRSNAQAQLTSPIRHVSR